MSVGLDFDIEQISRPGFKLAYFKDAALPIYQLTARVLTLEKKPINPIEEGCLRAIDAGLGRTKACTLPPGTRPSRCVEHRPPGIWRTQISTKPSCQPEASE